MSSLKIKEAPHSKIGEVVLSWAVPVVICNRLMGRDCHAITENLLKTTRLDQRMASRQFHDMYGHMVNSNRKRVLSMSYSLAAQVGYVLPETLIDDLQDGLGAAAFHDKQMAVAALGVAGHFIGTEKHKVAELNAWKQFFYVEVARRGDYDVHDLSEYNIGRYIR